MFDLEQSIIDWRQQMIAAGIQAPVPLEELEGHLRDEIEQQIETGLDASSAFSLAVGKVGKPQMLKPEFRRAGGILTWLGPDANSRMIRVLSAYWLITCIWGVCDGFSWVGSIKNQNGGYMLPITFIVYECIFIRLIIASFRLFRGDIRDKRLIWIVNLFFTVVSITLVIPHLFLNKPLDLVYAYVNMTFTFASFWFLRPHRKIKPAS